MQTENRALGRDILPNTGLRGDPGPTTREAKGRAWQGPRSTALILESDVENARSLGPTRKLKTTLARLTDLGMTDFCQGSGMTRLS